MSRTRRDLLRQDGSNELAFGVNVELPLDAHEDVVGRAQMHGAAPGDAAPFAFDDAPQCRDVELDRRQRFHGVGGAGRGGDGARRGLGHDQPVRGNDRDDDRRRPVAGQAADTMLVDDDRRIPPHPLADIDHGAGQVGGFVLVEGQGGAGGEEGREMDFRVAPGDHVAQDLGEGAGVEAVAIDALTHTGQRVDRRRMADMDRITVAEVEPLPRSLGETDLVDGNEAIAVDLKQGRLNLSASVGYQHLRPCRQALRATDMAIAAHDNHGLMLRVEPDASHPERRLSGNGRVCRPHSLNA